MVDEAVIRRTAVATADRDRCASAGLDLSRSTTELVAQGDLLLVIHEPQCAERAFTAALERPDLDAIRRALLDHVASILRADVERPDTLH